MNDPKSGSRLIVCIGAIIKLVDRKVRVIQHMAATSFWAPDRKPISAAQFIEHLFGELPAASKLKFARVVT
ncbi:MAG TPA: hypothetical protein VK822_32730 [Acetobacteraceae bacterium]|nr:hypothetical protein [Acetobacteraceae bacterium]